MALPGFLPDRESPRCRQASLTIVDPDSSTVTGFLRVFDGSRYRQLDVIAHEKFESDYRLPLEKVAALSGIKITAVDRDRAQKKSVFELGKYLISKAASKAQKIETRKMLLKWLNDKVMAAEDAEHTVFYVDVGSEIHRRAYLRDFGMTVVTDPDLNGGLKAPYYLLRVELSVLKAKIEKFLADAQLK